MMIVEGWEVAVFFILLAALSMFLVLFIRNERIWAKHEENRRARFDRALKAIQDAETLEEKIFRSNPENDGKPFIKER